MLKKEARNAGSTKGRLDPCRTGRFDNLAVGGASLSTSVATCTGGCHVCSGAEEGASTVSICMGDGDIGWERRHRLIKDNEAGCDCAFLRIPSVCPKAKGSSSITR